MAVFIILFAALSPTSSIYLRENLREVLISITSGPSFDRIRSTPATLTFTALVAFIAIFSSYSVSLMALAVPPCEIFARKSLS